MIEDQHLLEPLVPQLAQPYRSYLARYMWALHDGNFLIPKNEAIV